MNWLKYKINRWLNSDRPEVARTLSSASVEASNPNDFSLNIMNAMNGKIVQIRTYQPQKHGPDWSTEYYLVPEGERLSDAVTVLLMAKNLEKTQ